jgi:hypothetical protein
MNAVYVLEGRSLNTKLQRGFIADTEGAAHATMARKGSQMLRDAILRAKGYPLPEPLIIAPVAPLTPPAPKFHARKVAQGRPKKRGRKRSGHSHKVETIKALIAAHFKLSLDDLLTKNRAYERSHPRQIAMYLARKATTVSYPRIGKQFGGMDHTTVVYAVRQVEKRIAAKDAETINALHAVHAVIGG